MDTLERFAENIDDYESFKDFITRELKNDKDLFHKNFWTPPGGQTTLLNYLIDKHDLTTRDLKKQIVYLLNQGADLNYAQPLHLAFELKKMDVVFRMLNNKTEEKEKEKEEGDDPRNNKARKNNIPEVDANARDLSGHSLLYWTIQSGEILYVREALSQGAKIALPNSLDADGLEKVPGLPLHQAVLCDFPDAVSALIAHGANIDAPFGDSKQTPLLIAAAGGKIAALGALLEKIDAVQQLDYESISVKTDEPGLRAIDMLCQRLDSKKQPEKALKGIAMLLCHGATAPRNEKWQNLLRTHRHALLEQVTEYTRSNPRQLATFIHASQDKNSDLHTILFVDNSWARPFRQLFGQVNKTAVTLGNLVKGQDLAENDQTFCSDRSNLNSEDTFNEDEQKFAQFILKYDQAIKGVTLFNPWSDMRWRIADGKVTTWSQVLQYAHEHANSRTKKIVDEMIKPAQNYHTELGDEPPIDGLGEKENSDTDENALRTLTPN